MAGFKVLWANEFIYAAAQTYRANFPDTFVDPRDIRIILVEEILDKIGLEKGELDLLEGSPPCADFSISGKRKTGQYKLKKYSETKQKVDDLFWEFARILEELQPKVFIAENVAGLALGTVAKDILGSEQMDMFGAHEDTIFYALTQAGYNVRYKVLSADNYGTPQARPRLIFLGIRKDLDKQPTYPPILPYIYTAEEALDNLVISPEDLKPTIITPKEWQYKWLSQMKPGENIGDYHPTGAGFTARRLDPTKPSVTILAEVARCSHIFHPTESRLLSVPELKRLHGYPDDFILVGTKPTEKGKFEQNCERIGRSVPPPLYYHVGAHIRDKILGDTSDG